MNDPDASAAGGRPAPPVLRVVRGEPTPEEVGALVAVLAARSGGPEEPPPPVHSAWTDRSRLVSTPLPHGPGVWVGSGRP